MRISLLITLILYTNISFAQSKLDSLEAELEKCETDTGKISVLIELTNTSGEYSSQIKYAKQAFEIGLGLESIRHKSRSELTYGSYLAETNPDSGIFLMNRGIERYTKDKMFKYAANAIFVKGVTYEIISLYDSAINSYEELYELASEKEIHPEWGDAAYALAYLNSTRGNNATALKWAFEAKNAYEKGGETKKIGQTFNEIGIIYDHQGLYSEALDNYLKAKDYAINTDDIEGEILISNNIGVIYDNMNNSEMAMEYYSDGLEKARIHNLESDEATLLNNLSYVHLSNGDTARSIQLLKESLSVDLSTVYPCFESYPLEGLGDIFIAQNKLDSAEHLLNRALDISTKCEDVMVLVSVYKGLGKINLKKGKVSKAYGFLTKSLALSKKAQLPSQIKLALFGLYEFYKKNGDLKRSLQYLEEYQSLSDSLNQQNNIEKATKLAAEYDFRKQTAEMERERVLVEQKMKSEIEAKVLENRLLIFGACLVLILALVLVRAYLIIKKNNEKLRYLNEEKNKLIGIVAHDLRNPLNMIMGITPLIEDATKEVKDEHFDKYLEILNGSGQKMASMIERVLDISAIENMKLNLKIEKIDLNQLTKQSIDNFGVIARQKQINILDEIEINKEHYSEADPNYLEQVIDNLISNAIKFSDAGKNIFVSLKSEDSKNIIEVRDEGPGIAKEDQESLFKAFKTASSKPTAQERSTGLGLSIAMKFIKAMNGQIELVSELGQGTTFRVLLASA